MGKRLYVGGIAWETTEQGLADAFSKAGTVVSATIITDPATGKSKGFGFVEMDKDEEAQNAISMLHDSELDGRRLTVNEARPKTDRPRQSWGDRSGGDRGGRSWGNDRGGNRNRY